MGQAYDVERTGGDAAARTEFIPRVDVNGDGRCKRALCMMYDGFFTSSFGNVYGLGV